MPVSIDFTFVGGVGNKAKASEVNANFRKLASKFTESTGGIADADIYSFADINAHKLSSSPGKRLIASKFEPGAVDATALKSDATAGSPAAAVGTSNHIKNAVVTREKLKMSFVEVLSGVSSLLPGVSVGSADPYNVTSEFPIGAYIKFQDVADPSTAPAQWIQMETDIRPVSGSTWTFRLTMKNTHPSLTMTFAANPIFVFVYLQN